MTKNITASILVLLLLSTCGIDSSELIFKTNEYRGVAVLQDDALQSQAVAAKNVRIYLTDQDRDTTRYIIYVKTDSTGGFFFDHLPEKGDRNFYMYAHYISKGVIYESTFDPVPSSPNSPPLQIAPKYRPGIRIMVKDSLSGSVVSGVKVCLFNDQSFALGADCSNSIATRTSNAAGIALFDNLKAGKYVAKVSDNIGSFPVSGFAKVTSDASKLTDADVRIQRAGISLQVIDKKSKEPVPGVNVCLFTNELLAADSICVNSLQTIVTDAYGKAFVNGLSSGKHYFVVNDTVKSIVFKGLTSTAYVTGVSPTLKFEVRSYKK
ncbi:MAG TPA: carboxypeptidase-like regulatory domain-containing protein [Cyclobacteriaceae bacterium]|nr:carboxypeptidase-like regulatory domain-containing protein [Cyclobacteriaceae bacterium]